MPPFEILAPTTFPLPILAVATAFIVGVPPERYLPKRKGERFASALTKMNLNNKIIRLSAKIRLGGYVKNFLMNNH